MWLYERRKIRSHGMASVWPATDDQPTAHTGLAQLHILVRSL
jgi:hypothetical protein